MYMLYIYIYIYISHTWPGVLLNIRQLSNLDCLAAANIQMSPCREIEKHRHPMAMFARLLALRCAVQISNDCYSKDMEIRQLM